MKNKKHKGYALLITIVLVAFLSTISLAALTTVYRYNARLEKAKIELQEQVK